MRDIVTDLVELIVKTDEEYLLERVPINSIDQSSPLMPIDHCIN